MFTLCGEPHTDATALFQASIHSIVNVNLAEENDDV